jgi:hypothetical protein
MTTEGTTDVQAIVTQAPSTQEGTVTPEASRIAKAAAMLVQDADDAPVAESSTPDGDGEDESPSSPGEVKEAPAETPKPGETSKEEPKEARVAQRIAEFQKREASLADDRKAFDDERSKFEAEKATFKEVQFLLANAKQNPSALLEKTGLTFQELADAMIAEKNTPDPVKQALNQVNKKISSLEEERAKEKKEAEELKAKEEQAKIERNTANYQRMIGEHIEANKETYELTHALGASNLVWDIVEEFWHSHSKVLPVERACQLAEDYLEKRAEIVRNTKKFSGKKPAQNKSKTPSTLTNSMSSGAVITSDNGTTLSTEERQSRAARMLRFDD